MTTLVDLILHGGQVLPSGSFNPPVIQAVTQEATQWLLKVATNCGVLVEGSLLLGSEAETEAVFALIPEEFKVI